MSLPKDLENKCVEYIKDCGVTLGTDQAAAIQTGWEGLWSLLSEGGSEPQRYNSVDGSMDSGGSLVSLEDYQELQRENASLSKINDDFEIAYQNDIREKQYLVNQRNSAEAERDKLKSLLKECVEDLKQATAPLNQDPLKNAAEIMTERWTISFKILERLTKDQKGSSDES